MTYLLAGVLERHDAAQVETLAFSWGRRNDGPARRRIEGAFSRFLDITDIGDEEVVGLMRELGVDIAVDLAGHTLGQRTGILARRAAPVQVNFLGFPATMGASYIDYLIGDSWVVPDDQRVHYSEKLVLLPGSFQPNDGARQDPPDYPPRAALGLPATGFVFCAFNRNAKMTLACFSVWMRLLGAVPGSVLWLLASDPLAQRNLRAEAQHRGVDAGRLVFASDLPYAAYLARFGAADLFLDTMPFNGGATASDALSTGLPVLTCMGRTWPSLRTSLGLHRLVTHSLDEYEAAALRLATDPGKLSALRRELRARRALHALFDPDRYCRHLERAYREMWHRHAAGLPPAEIAVA